MKKLLVITTSVLLLSACSDGPSESDIKRLSEQYIEQQLSQVPKELAMDIKMEIKTDVDNVSCKEVSDDVYSCTYTSTTEFPSPQSNIETPVTMSEVITAKFKKVDGKWTHAL